MYCPDTHTTTLYSQGTLGEIPHQQILPGSLTVLLQHILHPVSPVSVSLHLIEASQAILGAPCGSHHNVTSTTRA